MSYSCIGIGILYLVAVRICMTKLLNSTRTGTGMSKTLLYTRTSTCTVQVKLQVSSKMHHLGVNEKKKDEEKIKNKSVCSL
jgi:hypothetical protein